MAWQSVVPTLALMALSVAPVLLGRAGAVYMGGASILSLGFVCFGAQLALRRSNMIARRLLLASIVYLPVVFVLLVFDKR